MAPFLSMLREPHKFRVKAVEELHRWATSVGFNPSVDMLPYWEWCAHQGSVSWASLQRRTPGSSKWHCQ